MERWEEYEIAEWDEVRTPTNTRPHGVPWQFWPPITSEEEFRRFIEQAQNWVSRFTASNEHQISLMMAEDAEQFWINPRSHQPNLVWRGQSCAKWKLASTAQRYSNRRFLTADLSALPPTDLANEWEAAEDAVILAEGKLIDRVQRQFGREEISDIRNLAWAQHEGSNHAGQSAFWATRLLDVSRDPLVALYFATEECPDHPGDECDGRVAVFDDILLRPVTDEETLVDIRNEIGAIWHPSNQHENMEAQKGAFLITGLLSTNTRNVLDLLRIATPTAQQSGITQIGTLSLTPERANVAILSDLALRLQDICIPGIKPASFGSILAFIKNQNQEFPPIVTQSVRIAGSSKPLIRNFLKQHKIDHQSLFPSYYGN
jgi:hypothetical protein